MCLASNGDLVTLAAGCPPWSCHRCSPPSQGEDTRKAWRRQKRVKLMKRHVYNEPSSQAWHMA